MGAHNAAPLVGWGGDPCSPPPKLVLPTFRPKVRPSTTFTQWDKKKRSRTSGQCRMSLTVIILYLFFTHTEHWHRVMSNSNLKGSKIPHPSIRSLLVVEERMRSCECFQHWLVTGRAYSHKTMHQLLPRGIITFPISLSLPPSHSIIIIIIIMPWHVYGAVCHHDL